MTRRDRRGQGSGRGGDQRGGAGRPRAVGGSHHRDCRPPLHSLVMAVRKPTMDPGKRQQQLPPALRGQGAGQGWDRGKQAKARGWSRESSGCSTKNRLAEAEDTGHDRLCQGEPAVCTGQAPCPARHTPLQLSPA